MNALSNSRKDQSHTKLQMKAIQHEIEIHGIVYFQIAFEFLKYIDHKNHRTSISYLVITRGNKGEASLQNSQRLIH